MKKNEILTVAQRQRKSVLDSVLKGLRTGGMSITEANERLIGEIPDRSTDPADSKK